MVMDARDWVACPNCGGRVRRVGWYRFDHGMDLLGICRCCSGLVCEPLGVAGGAPRWCEAHDFRQLARCAPMLHEIERMQRVVRMRCTSDVKVPCVLRAREPEPAFDWRQPAAWLGLMLLSVCFWVGAVRLAVLLLGGG